MLVISQRNNFIYNPSKKKKSRKIFKLKQLSVFYSVNLSKTCYFSHFSSSFLSPKKSILGPPPWIAKFEPPPRRLYLSPKSAERAFKSIDFEYSLGIEQKNVILSDKLFKTK